MWYFQYIVILFVIPITVPILLLVWRKSRRLLWISPFVSPVFGILLLLLDRSSSFMHFWRDFKYIFMIVDTPVQAGLTRMVIGFIQGLLFVSFVVSVIATAICCGLYTYFKKRT